MEPRIPASRTSRSAVETHPDMHYHSSAALRRSRIVPLVADERSCHQRVVSKLSRTDHGPRSQVKGGLVSSVEHWTVAQQQPHGWLPGPMFCVKR